MERLRIQLNIIHMCFLSAPGPCAPASEVPAAAEGELDAVVVGIDEGGAPARESVSHFVDARESVAEPHNASDTENSGT